MFAKCKKANCTTKKKVVTGIVSAFLVLSICLFLYVVVQVLSKGYVSFGGYSFFKVITGSMGESLPVNSLTITKDQDINTIEKGDIVTFKSESPSMMGEVITHRVVNIVFQDDGKRVLQTKGDANLSMDGYYVDSDHLIGKVVWSTADDGLLPSLVGFFTDKSGFIICVVFPVLLIAAFVMSDCAKKMKSNIDEVVDQLDQNGKSDVSEETVEEMRLRIMAELKEELKASEVLEDKN